MALLSLTAILLSFLYMLNKSVSLQPYCKDDHSYPIFVPKFLNPNPTRPTFNIDFLMPYYIEIILSLYLCISVLYRLFCMIIASVKYISFSTNPVYIRKIDDVFRVSFVDLMIVTAFIIKPLNLFVLLSTHDYCYDYFPSQKLFHITLCKRYFILIKYMSYTSVGFSICIMSPSWLIFIRLILANDVELIPGFVNSFFQFLQLEPKFIGER